MARAIVTYARGWQALSITRSLGRQGIDVYCGEEAPFAPCFFSRYCKGNFQYPSATTDPEGFLDFLEQKVIELKPPDGEPYVLVPVHKETWLIAQHRERFEPHIQLPVTSFENMVRSHDKGRLADLATELEVLIPPTRQFRTYDDVYRAVPEMNFPVFLKVREGASGVGILKCDTAEELTTGFKRFVEGYNLEPDVWPLVQDGVPGDDYCTSILFDRGKFVAAMTYRNIRAFPRVTGAGSLRETVSMPEAEAAAAKLLSHLNWHGIAEVDFRAEPGGPAYLIEVNPRFFGGLPQAVAANVDYPHLLYRIACGETIDEDIVADTSVRTETPLTGLLATLDEIARDDRVLDRLRKVRDEASALGRSDVRDAHLTPLLDALKDASRPRDVRDYLESMFSAHQGTINDVVHADDPMPALGVLYPAALMLRHGKLSMGVITSEAELDDPNRQRRGLRAQLSRLRWRTVALTLALFALSTFLASWAPTRDNIGQVLGWARHLSAAHFGAAGAVGSLGDALGQAALHGLDLGVLYLVSALLLREGRGG